jgi:hypothetical protein
MTTDTFLAQRKQLMNYQHYQQNIHRQKSNIPHKINEDVMHVMEEEEMQSIEKYRQGHKRQPKTKLPTICFHSVFPLLCL